MIGLQVQKFVSSWLSLPLWGSMHFFGSTEGKHLRFFFSVFFCYNYSRTAQSFYARETVK